MPKSFTDALQTELEPDTNNVVDDTSTDDVAETDTKTADADTSDNDTTDDAAKEGKTDAEADAKEDEKPDEDSQETGSWFAPKKEKVPAKPAKEQKKMPDSVRAKLEADAAAKVRDKLIADEFPWAQGISKEEGQAIRTLSDLGKTQPIALLDRIIRSVHQNPVTQKQLLDYFDSVGLVPKGSAQATTGQPGQGNADAMPELVIDTPQGASQAAITKWQNDIAQWQQRQILAKVNETLAPIIGDRDRATAQAEQHRALEAVKENVSRTIISRPGFKENQDEIQKAYNALPRPWKGLANEQAHLEFVSEPQLLLDAYHTVMQGKAVAANAKKIAADLKKKQDVNVVNPQSGGQGGETKKNKGLATKTPFLEALKQASKS